MDPDPDQIWITDPWFHGITSLRWKMLSILTYCAICTTDMGVSDDVMASVIKQHTCWCENWSSKERTPVLSGWKGLHNKGIEDVVTVHESSNPPNTKSDRAIQYYWNYYIMTTGIKRPGARLFLITDQIIYLKNPLHKNNYFDKISKISKNIYLKNSLQKIIYFGTLKIPYEDPKT